MKLINSLYAGALMLSNTHVFNPKKFFKGKRVAVIGAADSAFEQENGKYIDSFDVVVRVNKAIQTWNPEQEKYIGKKTDILFHSFYENEESGGGAIDFQLLGEFKVLFLVHPNNDLKGYRTHFNFYKRHQKPYKTWLLKKNTVDKLRGDFGKYEPTVGFSALGSVLRSPCKEIYITGFSFFRTPYQQGYRDHLIKQEANEKHIKNQGLHDPELEFQQFLKLLDKYKNKNISLDPVLESMVKTGI